MGERSSSKHPIGSRCIDGTDLHQWEPVSFRFETQLLDGDGRVLIRQPSIEEAHVYFICRPCRGWTYEVFDWVGFYLGDPHQRDHPEEESDDSETASDQHEHPADTAAPRAPTE